MDKKRILVIDDETSITKFLKFALERSQQYEVRCEQEGGKAVTAVRSFSPHLILLDVNMPDMQGGEVSALLKEDPVFRNIPIIFLTGMLSQEEMQSGLTIGGRPAVAKPIQIEKLIECIEKNISP